VWVAILAAGSAGAGERAWWRAPAVEGSLYLDIQRRSKPEVVGVEAGISGQYTDFVSSRLGLALLDSDSDLGGHVFGGVTANRRYAPPWCIAPFAGVGGFFGTWEDEVRADCDGLDNDDDGMVDEYGERRTEHIDGILVAYPEVGLHLWLFGGLRLTVSGRYHLTSAGRDYDGRLANVGLSLFLPE
jgi:hypothetical protein